MKNDHETLMRVLRGQDQLRELLWDAALAHLADEAELVRRLKRRQPAEAAAAPTASDQAR